MIKNREFINHIMNQENYIQIKVNYIDEKIIEYY
jgi:hypothetical protein